MELNSGELPEPPDDGWQEWNAERDHGASDLTEAELRRLIEQWRQGDSDAANRVWRYIYETYYQRVLDRVSTRLRLGLPAREANNNGVDQDEDRQELDELDTGKDGKVTKKRKIRLSARKASKDGEARDEDQQELDELDMGKDDDGEASGPVAVGHRTQGPRDAKVPHATESSSDDARNQLHDYVMGGGLQMVEDLDLRGSRKIFVTQNEQLDPDGETYTGNYSGRSKLGRREDFEWKGKAAFGRLVKDIWVNRSIDVFRSMTHNRSTVSWLLVKGDIPDVQRFQEAVDDGTGPIDRFLQKRLEVCRKEGEWLSELVVLELLNGLIDGELLSRIQEIGCVAFDGLKIGVEDQGMRSSYKSPRAASRRRRANREMLVKAYPGLIQPATEATATRKDLLLDHNYESMEEDRKARGLSVERTVESEYQPLSADHQMMEQEAVMDVFIKLCYEVFRLSELKETLPEGSPARRLVEGLIIFRKWQLWNASPVRPPLRWTLGTAVTEEDRMLLDELLHTFIEQLIHAVDRSLLLNDPRENRQPLYVEATKFIVWYCTLDLPGEVSKADMEKTLTNTCVYQPKCRLRTKLKPIVKWFYRDKDKNDEEVGS